MPSHFISNAQFSWSRGSVLAATADIGTRSRGIGSCVGSAGGLIRWIIHWSPFVRNSAYFPSTRSPCKVTITSSSRSFSAS